MRALYLPTFAVERWAAGSIEGTEFVRAVAVAGVRSDVEFRRDPPRFGCRESSATTVEAAGFATLDRFDDGRAARVMAARSTLVRGV